MFYCRHPFKVHSSSNFNHDDDDDDDEEYVDLLDDDEDESFDREQPATVPEIEQSAQGVNHQSIRSSNDSAHSTASRVLIETDQFISDDEEDPKDYANVSSSLSSTENKQIFLLLDQTHGLMIRARKLVKIIRNTSVIDSFVRYSQGGCLNGFIIDIQVSAPVYSLRFQLIFLDNDINLVNLKVFLDFVFRSVGIVHSTC